MSEKINICIIFNRTKTRTRPNKFYDETKQQVEARQATAKLFHSYPPEANAIGQRSPLARREAT